MGLRERLREDRILVAPGIFDALTGMVATSAGAEAVYLSGASIAYTRFGRPDIGLVGMAEVAETVSVIRERIETPLIVDADTGFGNALNVQRTVRLFERMGASAIQLEDQTLPKRCGHLAGKTLVSPGEMRGKIRAALDARASEATLVIARTDAIAVEGIEAALDRAESYAEAGADVLFVEAPQDAGQIDAIMARLKGRAPLMANMVEGGKTPLMAADELQGLGYSLVIFPGGAVRALAATAVRYYGSLVKTGSNAAMGDAMFQFDGLQDADRHRGDAGGRPGLRPGGELMAPGGLDPVTLAILKGRLEQIADEMDATLFRERLQPDHRRGARRVARHLRCRHRRHAGAGQVGAADLRRRHGLRREGGDRQGGGAGRAARRRRLDLQRAL